jgi:hypothetical protein
MNLRLNWYIPSLHLSSKTYFVVVWAGTKESLFPPQICVSSGCVGLAFYQ